MKKILVNLTKAFALVSIILLLLDFIQPILPSPIYPLLLIVSGFYLVVLVLDRMLGNSDSPTSFTTYVTFCTVIITASLFQMQTKDESSRSHGFLSANLCLMGDLQKLVGLTDNPPAHPTREDKSRNNNQDKGKEKIAKKDAVKATVVATNINSTESIKSNQSGANSFVVEAIKDPNYKAGQIKVSKLDPVKPDYKILTLDEGKALHAKKEESKDNKEESNTEDQTKLAKNDSTENSNTDSKQTDTENKDAADSSAKEEDGDDDLPPVLDDTAEEILALKKQNNKEREDAADAANDDLPPVLSDAEQEENEKVRLAKIPSENATKNVSKLDISKIDLSEIPEVDRPAYIASLQTKHEEQAANEVKTKLAAKAEEKTEVNKDKKDESKIDLSNIPEVDRPSYLAAMRSKKEEQASAGTKLVSTNDKANSQEAKKDSEVDLSNIPEVDRPSYFAALQSKKEEAAKNKGTKSEAKTEDDDDDLPPVLDDDVPVLAKKALKKPLVLSKKEKMVRMANGKLRKQRLLNIDLMDAVSTGNIPLVELTIDRGAEITFRLKRNKKSHLLFRAASTKKAAKLVSILVQKGADVNEATTTGRTPLFVHTQMNRYEAVKYLLSNKANPNLQAKDGSSAIYTAAKEGRLRILKLLIKHGGKTAVKLRNGRNPLMAAAVNGHVKTVAYLLSKGANPSLRDKNGLNSIDYANGNEHKLIAQMLSRKINR